MRALVVREVLRAVAARRGTPAIETVTLEEAPGRILAAEAAADRDYPPFDRATRDGIAVRSAISPAASESWNFSRGTSL